MEYDRARQVLNVFSCSQKRARYQVWNSCLRLLFEPVSDRRGLFFLLVLKAHPGSILGMRSGSNLIYEKMLKVEWLVLPRSNHSTLTHVMFLTIIVSAAIELNGKNPEPCRQRSSVSIWSRRFSCPIQLLTGRNNVRRHARRSSTHSALAVCLRS